MKSNLLLVYAILFSFVFTSGISAQSQENNLLPLDPAVRYGKLDNGLTYYIRHNEKPKDRADFYIVQKVGSVIEEDSQQGLAHFLEHMAFNGTKNFPGNGIISYLEKNGVKFGANVNAYTSIDQTVYNLSSVPTTNPGFVDSCILILHDWSNFISLEDEEIDKERGVIHEEWRTRSNAQMRMLEKDVLPVIYPNNRYGNRLPIGKMDVVDNFSYEELRNYYNKWYRPDLQAIVIVGDIDVNKVEAKIKDMWKDIPKQENPAKRIYYSIEDNKEPLAAISKDKEATRNIISLMYKKDVLPDSVMASAQGFTFMMSNKLISLMYSSRFNELAQKSDAPFINASADFSSFLIAKTKKAFNVDVLYKENEWAKSLDAALAVVNSVKGYGFTASEFERAKAQMKSMFDNSFKEKDKAENESYVTQYVNNFLESVPAPGIEIEYALFNQIIPNITLDYINNLAKSYITDDNLAIMMLGIDKDGMNYPTKDELIAEYNNSMSKTAVAYVDEVSNEPLITKLPKSGKIDNVSDGFFNTKVWKLSNGATVILKNTDFKKNEILFSAVSKGGTSLLPESDAVTSKVISSIISSWGVANFSDTNLRKMLAGKNVSFTPSISLHEESMNGACSPKDIETLMQLQYLFFTAPRPDNDAFMAWKNNSKNQLKNISNNPGKIIQDSLTSAVYNNNPYTTDLKIEEIDNIDLNHILDVYKKRFSDASDFTFIFVGNIDATALYPLVEQYIASLPSKGKKENFKEIYPKIVSGNFEKRFEVPMLTPKVTVINVYSIDMYNTLLNAQKASIFQQVLKMAYTKTIREEEGGSYGVSVEGEISDFPKDQYYLIYSFDTGEEKRDKLEQIAFDQIKKIAQQGPEEENFGKVKEYMVKQYNENIKENGYWLSIIDKRVISGLDKESFYLQTLNSITSDDIKDFASKLLNSNNRAQIVATGVAINSDNNLSQNN
ncbi:MAG: insulinase family protein [Bacteroidales bacterium]|nr:insulinase family protein [Bacteroidales bacterium]